MNSSEDKPATNLDLGIYSSSFDVDGVQAHSLRRWFTVDLFGFWRITICIINIAAESYRYDPFLREVDDGTNANCSKIENHQHVTESLPSRQPSNSDAIGRP